MPKPRLTLEYWTLVRTVHDRWVVQCTSCAVELTIDPMESLQPLVEHRHRKPAMKATRSKMERHRKASNE
jgi:hypothetical protein